VVAEARQLAQELQRLLSRPAGHDD
jgi:hypothetical protein